MDVFFVIAEMDGQSTIVDCDITDDHLLSSFSVKKWKAIYPNSTPKIIKVDSSDILKLIEKQGHVEEPHSI